MTRTVIPAGAAGVRGYHILNDQNVPAASQGYMPPQGYMPAPQGYMPPQAGMNSGEYL